ncbi:hypothetical protein GCM10009720_23780 [Yaniella flava]|uniref:ORF 12 gene product N-terminal domain-containing protein n=1 Tax=Yaniella flava TaxID=287930 RepID=A0ABP5GAZ8_9MICC
MQRPQLRTTVLTAVAATALAFTGCVADPETADDLPDRGSAPTHVAEVNFPDTEAARTSQWVVDEINATRSMNKQDWYPKVAPEMSDEIPVDSLVGTLNSELRPSLPYVPSNYEEPEENYGITRLTPDLTAGPIDLHIQIDDTGRITDLWYEELESADSGETATDDEDAETNDGLGS